MATIKYAEEFFAKQQAAEHMPGRFTFKLWLLTSPVRR